MAEMLAVTTPSMDASVAELGSGRDVLYLHDVDLADVAHHYVFKLIIYGVVFYGWMLYTRTVTPDEAKA